MDPGTPSSSQALTDFHEPISHDQSDMQYDEAFPALQPNPSGSNSGPTSGLSSPGASSKWTQNSQKMRIGSHTVTSVFHIPYEERSDRSHGASFGEMDAMKTCAEISKESGAHIEMSNSRDQSLTFLVTGKQSAVLEAKRSILAQFQTQAQTQVSIPKEHHGFILGKQGANLSELETQTATKITVPRTNEKSNMITIQGTREGIEKAVHKIRLLSDERSKQANERLSIPKKFHPFICGPNNSKVKALESENAGIRINIPPPSVMSDEIYIVGEKDGVARAVEVLKQEHEECKKYNHISIEIKKPQHRYIIGHKRTTINEIFSSTGVMVELPPNDQNSDTVTLRGPTEALGTALNLVYEKANSVITRTVDAPEWIHKYIIGKKGANIRNMTVGLGYNNVRVDVKVSDKESQIVIEGPPDEVEPVTQEFQKCVNDLIENKYFKDISVDPKFHKHIIGKNGANVNRLKEETGVIISVKDGQSAIIHLEGLKSGVEQAAKLLLEQVEKLESEKETDLIIEHRFHGNIIGARGENIREIRDKFNQVQITFPAPGEKRDVVTVRGPKDDVDKCCRHLKQVYIGMLESSYQLKVPVFPQCYRLVVGKGGQNIRKIREDTKTRFDLPPLDEGKNKNEPEIIVITGRKQDCEAARDQILSIQNSQANVVEIDVMIPNQHHNWLIGTKGKIVQSISEDCGGVHIKFPDAKSKSDRVSVIGPKEDVEKAKSILLDMTRNKEINSYTETLEAKAQHHRFLIGKNGSNIRKIREGTKARIIFPNEGETDDIITIIGKKENVLEAKKQLQDILKDLDKIVEAEMDVDPQYHRHFVLRRGEVLHKISDELGGVQISFPKANSNSSRVVLKGATECVEAAKKRIAQIVDDLSNRITVDVVIEQKHHRTIMGKGGSKVQQIQSEYNVDIKFPDRNDDPDFVSDQNDDGIKFSDIIRVTGRPENCEGAKNALLEQVPVVVEVDIPFEMHRFIIGQKGKDVRELMRTYDVNITVPPSEQQSNTIMIIGSPKSAANAKEALLEKRNQLEQEKADKEARSFELQIKVEPEFHPKIIGRRGAVITEIRQKYDVNIQLPRKDEPDDIITITGLEDQAIKARDEILDIVKSLTELVKEDIEIDHRVHSRIIGSRGKNVREIMKQFGVEIRFPRSGESNPDLVSVSGNDEEKVYEASDHLKNLAEEYLQDVNENEYMQQFVREPNQGQDSGKKEKQSNGFVVKGAPWEAPPDTQSNEEFPSFGTGNGVANDSHRPLGTAWGPRKHY